MRRPLTLVATVLAVVMALPAPASAAEDVSAKLKAARERANAAAGRFAAAESKLALVEDRAARIKAEAAEAEAHLAQAQVRVRQMALRQYVSGGIDESALGDVNSAARGRAMLGMAVSGTRDDLDRFRVARADLLAARSALDHQLDAMRKALAGLRSQRAAIQAELTRLAQLQKDLEARAARASRAARSASRSQSGATGVIAGGSWVCPVQGPRAFTNDWHQPRSGGRLHEGTDILSPRGTPVVASVAGTVKDHSSSLGGLSYFLYGDDGTMYFGTHLNGYAASGRVAAGTVIGYVGNSGNASGGPTHLHFEIHPGGGGPVNPYPTLSRYC